MLTNPRVAFDYLRMTIHARFGNEDGASALEYALLIALIAAVIVVAVFILGNFIKGTFTNTCSAISSQPGAPTVTGMGNCTGA